MSLDVWSAFARGSSDIDWCEENYVVTIYIAEFYNTISNAVFFICPPILMFLYCKYAKEDRWSHLVWCLLIMVGIGSTYFHATLTLAGQLLDEICILWVLVAALGTWLPLRFMTPKCRTQKRGIRFTMLILVVLLTILSFAKPVVNAFALLLSGIPITVMVIKEVKRMKSQRAYNLGIRIVVMWVVAVCVWLSDRFYCGFWRSVHFPYLHSIWHILVSFVGYQGCVLMSYVYAIQQRPLDLPVLRYWPRDSNYIIGIPYLCLSQNAKSDEPDVVTAV